MLIRGIGAAVFGALLLAAPLNASPAPAEPAAGAQAVVAAVVPEAPPRTLDVPEAELAIRAPAEPPPPDFTAAQFIDSTGCVLVRTAVGWRARIARDGSAICGYPPTFSARRSGPDEVAPLFAEPEEPRAQKIERVLTETILPSLREGELAPASAPGQPTAKAAPHLADAAQTESATGAAAAPPSSSDPIGFAAAVAAAPTVGPVPPGPRTDRLCDLIGANRSASPGVSGSSALGFCGSETAPLPTRIVAAFNDIPTPAANVPSAESATLAATGDAPAVEAKPKASKQLAGTGRETDRKRAPVRTAAPKKTIVAVSPHLIPPGARYVQIGVFRNGANAARTVQRLVGMGFPVVRSSKGDGQAVMVGPLDGREAIVRAIDRVRKAGYRDAYARR